MFFSYLSEIGEVGGEAKEKITSLSRIRPDQAG